MWIRQRAAGGTWSKVFMIGSPISSSGVKAASPSSRLPMQAPSIVSSGVPRSGSGTSGTSGGRRKRTTEVTFSPTPAAQSRQMRTASAPTAPGKRKAPA